MLRRWLLYLAVVVGCIIFVIAYQEQLAWTLLASVLCLPLLGFVVSAPILFAARPKFSMPAHCTMGDPVETRIDYTGPLPFGYRFRIDGYKKAPMLKPGALLPTAHCGCVLYRPVKIRIYDCMGLFFRPLRRIPPQTLLVRPKPVPVKALPQLEEKLTQSWRPKPGGGFAENHELRLYRPGDSLNQVHWKLSAKTKKYIIREAMEPSGMEAVLSLSLGGTPEENDRKLGRLLWLGEHLLEKGLIFHIRALSGATVLDLPVANREALMVGLDRLLAAPPAATAIQEDVFRSSWCYCIGGEPDEN